MPLCTTRILVTSYSRLFPREISRSFAALTEQPPTSPKKPRASPRLRTPNTTRSPDAAKRPKTVQPLSKQRRLLEPYELSKRLIALCEQGDADLAVRMLQNAPRGAQNVKVWNTLIQQCMNAEKYKLAFNVFMDMKRRGFMPNIRTYATLMSGYANVEDWEPLTKQLGFAHSIYGQLKQQLKTSHNLVEDRASGETSSFVQYPIALYISILGKAGKYQKAIDVFRELDTDGPLAPYPKVYSALLCVMADRVGPDNAEATAQAVSDAKYVWRRHMRSLDKQPEHHIEPRSVDAIVKVLSRGEPSDHELMFDILRDICGLPRPGEGRPSSLPKVKPNLFILNEALDSCTAAGRPEMTVHYAQTVMGSPELRPILRVFHLHKLFRAYAALAKGGAPTQSENAAAWIEYFMAQAHESSVPNHHALTIALGLCHHSRDMPSALRIARATLEGPTARGSFPTKAWVHLFRLANMVSPKYRRQCLELLARHDSVLDVWESGDAFERLDVLEKKNHLSLAHSIIKLLRTPHRLSDPDARGGLDATDAGQSATWLGLRRRAELLITTVPSMF